MDRRKFIAASVAVGTATVTASSHAGYAVVNESQTADSETSATKPATWRLQYPLTKEEKEDGTTVHDLTFPTNDVRRYTPPSEVDDRAVMAEYYNSQ